MSFDLGIWHTKEPLGNQAAAELYSRLCNGDTTGLSPHPSIDIFYQELTALHPEIDDVPEDRVDDTDYCPWSIAFDRSPSHLLICSVWSKAEYVANTIGNLAEKHGLTVYIPAVSREFHPLSPNDEDDNET